MNIVGPYNSGVAVGNAGSATANMDHSTKVSGIVKAVYIDYKGTSPPATTDVTIRTKGTSPSAPSLTILKAENINTDGWFFPRAQVQLNTTGAAISAVYNEGMPINDSLNILIAGADADNNADVWLIVE
jgi:hypothetical protein